MFFLLLGANFFFCPLALFNFLSRSLTSERGYRGERQRPLIRLLLSVSQLLAPPIHQKKKKNGHRRLGGVKAVLLKENLKWTCFLSSDKENKST